MTKENKDKLKNRRVFQHISGCYILLTKAGKAVSFLVNNERDRIHVLEEMEGVDFNATGTQLKKEGWRCIGPGIEFEGLFKGKNLK
ncbi:MAG: hypothetical protein JRD93_12300 [Deltaproteobacteria bacterium]|nr:hypothetical protein [Deltaproteobacteria bacterium]MBW2662741.1 hypothetical protein [Deltaproteobacteria bacterium]